MALGLIDTPRTGAKLLVRICLQCFLIQGTAISIFNISNPEKGIFKGIFLKLKISTFTDGVTVLHLWHILSCLKAAAGSGQLCKSCVCISFFSIRRFSAVVSILIEGTVGTRQRPETAGTKWKTGNGYSDHAMTPKFKIQNSIFHVPIKKKVFLHNH